MREDLRAECVHGGPCECARSEGACGGEAQPNVFAGGAGGGRLERSTFGGAEGGAVGCSLGYAARCCCIESRVSVSKKGALA